MRKTHLFLLTLLSFRIQVKADSLSPAKLCPLPLKWELQLGADYFTNTAWSANKPLQDIQTLSGAFFTFLDLPFKRKASAFYSHIGIGASIQTFGLTKLIRYQQGRTIFTDFEPDRHYRYSYLQQIFVDMPLSIVHKPFHNLPFELEAGGIIGCQVYTEHRFCIYTTNENSVQTEEHIKNLNPFHYGFFGKINLNHVFCKRVVGLSYTLSGNYYISELFEPINHTPTKNFSIMLGLGLYINGN